jgi:hypothetical protein
VPATSGKSAPTKTIPHMFFFGKSDDDDDGDKESNAVTSVSGRENRGESLV